MPDTILPNDPPREGDSGWYMHRAYWHAMYPQVRDQTIQEWWSETGEDRRRLWRQIAGDYGVQLEKWCGNPNFNGVKTSWEK
jgi:hypothetical protein